MNLLTLNVFALPHRNCKNIELLYYHLTPVGGASIGLRDRCQLEIDTDRRKQLDLFIVFV